MKYKLLQKLPWLEIGMILDELQDIHPYSVEWYVSSVFAKQYPDFFEEVKEPKTIYDLKKGDIAFSLDSWGEIWEYKLSINWQLKENNSTTYFITEREAKRNKLLRELATRDKWLPDEREFYTTYNDYMNACKVHWNWKACDMIQYHMWLVFRDELEYNKYMTEENKKLLFNI